jgi:hypothetical protein
MEKYSHEIISKVLDLGGSFYLPYKTHYSWDQIKESYPEIIKWIKQKSKWDENHLFTSKFFSLLTQYIKN